ncbi:TonB-dependent receptor, partial [Undibacterium sp.]|uniref:TonB-dependent receptor n=1 Tax=Undibacterium sp. TaxID=1914977 RepID=UPI002BCC0B37
AAFKDHFGGYYKAVGPAAGNNVDRGDTTGGRLSLLLTPTKELTVRLTATAQDVRRDGLGAEDLNPLTGQPVDGDLTRRLYVPERYENRVSLYGLDVEYDFGWARLNAITSAQDVNIYENLDVSPNYVSLLVAAGFPAQSATLEANVKQHRVSQEFRLTSRPDTAVEWLAGAYLNREHATQEGGVRTALGMGLGNMALLTSSLPSSYSETAAYGDLTWHAAPKLSLTGGIRIARNRQVYTSNAAGILAGGATISGGHSEETTSTYLATAKYAIAPTSNVYFRAASGYRPGGPNALLPTTSTAIVPTSFKSDSLWSYELGYKADLLERTLSVEASVYDVEWTNLQQHIASAGFAFVTNAGNARVRGSELALKWRPAPGWNLSAAATTIDAYLTSDAPGLRANAGARLPQSARFSLALGAMRNFKVAEHDAYLGANAHYVGERNSGFESSAAAPNFKMPAYTLVDVQAGIDFRHFSVEGYIRNLANRRGILNAGTSANLVQAVVTQPRTIGMAVTVPF